MKRRALLSAAVAAVPLSGAPLSRARAQGGYPSRPVNVIVPLAAGSAADAAVRIAGARMAVELGQQLVIENVPGAAGLLGAERGARAAPDGYTLLGISDSVLTSAPLTNTSSRFNPITDLEPISQFAITEWVLVASVGSGLRTVPDLITAVKARPGRVDFTSGGIGSPQHVVMEIFKGRHGLDLTHVPCRSATAALNDVAAGNASVMFAAISVAQGMVTSGRLLGLATLGQERTSLLPDVPTMAEAGGGDMVFRTWTSFMAPARTPPEILRRINGAVMKAVADPDVRARLAGCRSGSLGQ